MRKLKLFFACLLMAVLSIGQVWADDPTITEDFELQTAGSTYNSHYSYEADASNAGIAWYVEHGVVSTNSKLSGEKSMQMRAYYAKKSAASAWNGALPYLESRTAVKGLKSITLKIAAANTLKIDILYSTNGTSWSPMKTDAATPADATSQTYTTSAATKTYNIPSSDVNTSYYIKFEVNSNSTHTANPSSTGNLVFRVDDIVFTYAVPAPSFTITAESNNTSYGSVALVGTTITATPETGYRISTSEPYSVAPANSATVAQNNNAFTVTPSANTTVTINFEAIPTYKVSFSTGTGNPSQDPITETLGGQGITLPDGPEPTCSTDGWEFAGWAEAPVNSQTTTAPTFLSGIYHPTANCTLYAVYKKSDSGSVIDQNVKETFENQTAGTTYNQTQTYTAANSNAGIAWSMYYGTVSTNDKIAGSNSAQMRWYSSATSSLGYIKTTTPISGLQSIDFKARVSTIDVKMSVWYSTNGEDWTLKDENLTFSAASSGLPFSSTINGTIGTDYYIKIGVGDGGTAPSSGNYKLIIDEVQFNYQAGAITTYYLSAPSCDVPTCSTPTISPNSGNFYGESQEVTIECTTEGASIYYIINGDDPTNGTLYEEPFSVTETSTVKAIAIKSGMNNSPIAEKTYTKVVPLATMADVQAAATSTDESTITVSIANWVVTAVSGSQVWFTAPDNLKGILLYNSGHGFTTGKKLNGLVIDTKVKLYNLYPELTSLAASSVTVTDADEVAARTTTIAELTSGHPAEQGTIVKLEGVTYSSSVLSDGVNSIAADNKFYSSLALIEGTTYDITGVVTYYKNGDNAVVKIAPRNADDVEAQTPAVIPTAANLAALKDADRGTYILTLDHAIVTCVNGKNAFIEDATAGALIFIQNHGYNAGDCLTGDYQVTTEDYQGKFEITVMEAQTGAEKTSGAEIPVTTLTIAQLNANFAANESKRIKIVGANVTDAISGSDRNGAINDGAALAVYASVTNTITLTANDNVDIIGYPGFYNTDQQLNVWRQEDITVNASEPPVDDPRKVAESPEDGFSSVSGNLSGNEISFAAYQGGSATAPNGNNTAHELRLYKYQESTNYGGYVTITAKTGCTIDQVVITVGGNCKVGYCKDAENFPTKEATPINVSTSNPFDTDKGLGASSVNVVNLDGSNQFKIKTITVYYTGEGIDLESIAISGDASVLEYTEGDAFNPAGLSVIGHYSDNSEAEITEGITWAFDPATLSTTDESVSVTATVGELTSAPVVVNGLTVSAAVAPTPSTDNVVILATHGTKLYAMSTSNSNNAFAAIEVTEDGANIVVTSEEAKDAIQWTRSSNGITATFQDANSKYLTATNGSTNLSLGEVECVWKWYAGEGKNCYSIENEDETKLRSFLYYSNNGIFKNYALSNAGGNYSGIAEVRVIAAENIVVVAPTTHTLSYNANGGTLMEGEYAIADAQVAEGAQVTVAANVYEKEGYVFAGWQYGETVYNAGQKFNMPTTDVELVAQWATISTDNVVIIAQSLGQWYAIQAEAGTANHTVKAVPIVYENNTIYLVESKRASITWERKSAGAQASFKNGTNYLTGKTSDSNDLDLGADECWWTFNSTSNIYQTHADHSLLYSESAEVFKNYKSSNAGKSGYSALPIVVPAVFGDPSYETVREELAPNAYYTMCLDKAVDAVRGGSIWRVLSKDQNDKDIILEEVLGTLEAGRPYIFFATADKLEVVYVGSAVLEEVNDEANNGLIGSFEKKLIDQASTNYILYNNELYVVNSENVFVGAHRAYLNMTGVPAYVDIPEVAGAPRRRVTMHTNAEQVATGIENGGLINGENGVQKLLINGQLFIIRGEKMYNANGQLVK